MVLTSLLRIRTLSRAPMSGPTALWPMHDSTWKVLCDWPWALESSWRAGQNFPNQNKLLFNNNLENMWLSRYLATHIHTHAAPGEIAAPRAWRWRCAEVQAQHPRCRGWFGVIRVGFSSTCSTPWGPPKLNSFLYRPMISNLRFTSSVCAAAVLSVLSCWHPSERTQNSAWTRTSTWL
jgi:hypothetical protein